MISTDLWELPQSRLTSAITDKTERNFYSRCPPEKRPRFMINETQMHEAHVSPIISQTLSVSSDKPAVEADHGENGFEPDIEKVCRSLADSNIKFDCCISDRQ